ncbi:MAG: hypothetical protein LUH18_08520 [Oscillospiraceae bacterium]|nr:hypothetical protein [Oscillospiraceae bacterium]
MKKILAIAVAVLMICTLSLSVFADDLYVLEEGANDVVYGKFADGVSVSGWYKSFITEYMYPEVMAEFLEAIQTDGAQIEITADVAATGVLLQAYADGAYTWANITDTVSVTTNSDGNYVVLFDAATLIAAYTDAGLSLDDVLNFGVDFNEGDAVVYGVKVVTGTVADTSSDATDDTSADNEADASTEESTDSSATEETTSSPDTGIVMAVLPMAIAAAAVVATKKR